MALPTTGTGLDVGHTTAHDAIYDAKAHFSCVGDGATDDTTGLQAALTAAMAAGAGTVLVQQGVYNHTGLTVDSRVRIVGTGTNLDESAYLGARLHYTPSTGTALTVTAPAANLAAPHIENIGFSGTSAANVTTGIYIDGTSNIMARGMLHNVRAKGFGTGIKTSQALEITFLNCYVVANGKGLHLTNNSNACSVIGGGYRENVTGVHIAGTGSVYIAPAVVVESNTATGLLVDGANVSALVIGGHYENNPRGIYFNATGADTITDSVLSGAYIAASATAALEVQRTSNLHGTIILTSAQTITLGALAQYCNITTTRPPNVYTDSGNFNLLQYTDSGVDGYTHIVNSAGLHVGNALQMIEVSAPAAPAANGVRIYARDNGAGKTQLVARFPTGAVQQIAIEP